MRRCAPIASLFALSLLLLLPLAACSSDEEAAPDTAAVDDAAANTNAPADNAAAVDEAPPVAPVEPAPVMVASAVCAGGLSIPAVDEGFEDLGGGLMYKDLTVGEGTPIAAGTRVDMHYAGFLEDGSMFDSSCTRGDTFPVTVGTGGVIQGWDIGLQGMAVGGRRVLIIPADLAYGDGGIPQIGIPGGATLIFDVEAMSAQ